MKSLSHLLRAPSWSFTVLQLGELTQELLDDTPHVERVQGNALMARICVGRGI